MTLKQFLKPDKRKVAILIALAFLGYLSLFPGLFIRVPLILVLFGILGIILDFLLISLFYPLGFLTLLVSIFYWYLLSCLTIWIYDKVKK